ncbi:MAG: hypothetical protein OEU32_02645 [Acidimicrobiia bacterium]|nr:hypothetical protein [Acidimicrobiia bacterium]
MSDIDPTLDDLVSAYIDGDASDVEAARVESDPALRARAEQLRFIGRHVAAPVTLPDDETRERHIAAALAASPIAANVTALAARRQRSARTMQIAAVAAVVAIVLLAVPLVLITRDGTDDNGGDTTASASFDADEELSDDSGDALDEGGADDTALDAAAQDPGDEDAVAQSAPAAEAEAPAEEAAPEEESAADSTDEPEAGADAEGDFAADDSAPQLESNTIVLVPPPTSVQQLATRILGRLVAPADGTSPTLELVPCADVVTAFLDDLAAELLGFTVQDIDGSMFLAIGFRAETDIDVAIFDVGTCTIVPAVPGG